MDLASVPVDSLLAASLLLLLLLLLFLLLLEQLSIALLVTILLRAKWLILDIGWVSSLSSLDNPQWSNTSPVHLDLDACLGSFVVFISIGGKWRAWCASRRLRSQFLIRRGALSCDVLSLLLYPPRATNEVIVLLRLRDILRGVSLAVLIWIISASALSFAQTSSVTSCLCFLGIKPHFFTVIHMMIPSISTVARDIAASGSLTLSRPPKSFSIAYVLVGYFSNMRSCICLHLWWVIIVSWLWTLPLNRRIWSLIFSVYIAYPWPVSLLRYITLVKLASFDKICGDLIG